ncbi:MAG: glycosyltransferase [Chloroflexota bacterium]
MKLLFVTPQMPWPPSQGTALRNFHLLRAVAQAHDVDLLSFGADGAMGVPVELRRLCGRIDVVAPPVRSGARRLRDLALGWADMERRLWSPQFAARLDAVLGTGAYDAVQLEGFEVAGYLLGPRALRREARDFKRQLPKVIFDDHNAEYQLQRSAAEIDRRTPARWPRAAYSLIQARRLRRREALYVCAAELCLAVSAEDAAALARIAPGVRPLVVPNGVDCASPPEPAPTSTPTLLFSGKLDYRPNVDACEWLVGEILPRVRAAVPGVRLVLAGRDPTPAVRALVGVDVEVTGALSETALTAHRSGAWAYVVPMRMGSGVRFKVLEAMAAALPVVSTSLGASGTGAIDGQHALIRDDAESFGAAVADLLRDGPRRRALGTAARGLTEREHDWRHITPRLLSAYRALETAPHPHASGVVTVLNERESVGRLVDSLGEQTETPAEVVIVDGGSTDGTVEALRGAGVTAIVAPGSNISQGRNRAVMAARHDAILATDSGVELHPSWAERLSRALAGGEAASGFFVSAPRSTWELALGATTLPDVGEIDPAQFLPSSRSVAFTRGAWERAGRYPEWLDYCEDLVFDFGLIAAGARPRFVPRAVVRFRPRRSPVAFFHQYFRYARGDGRADLWRRRHALRYVAYLAGLVVGVRALRPDGRALALLLIGGGAYLSQPFVRLAQQADNASAFFQAAPLVPLARLLGDAAKLAGYPVGVWWRLRRHRVA